MGRTAWTVAGGVVGAFFGYPQLGAVVGGAIGGIVDPEKTQGPRIGETSAQTAMEGAPRPIVYGTSVVYGNIISSGVLIKQDVETEGEKGGPVSVNEHAYRTFAIRICEGPIRGVLRIWEDEKLVVDLRPGSLMLNESQQWLYGTNLYLGDETQLPDTFLQILVSGIGETPAYRGTAYMVFVGRDLTDRRGSIPTYRFEVSTTEAPIAPGADWFDYVKYTGTGGDIAFQSLDLRDGGLVWVNRLDATEPVMMFYKIGEDGLVYEMGNKTIIGGTADNPTVSTAIFEGGGEITLPIDVSTEGGDYIAYVFKKSEGDFDIVQYFGDGIAGHAVPHSLGAVPAMHFVRQLDDPSNTIGFMHLQHFNGLSFMLITADNNVSDSSQQWNNTAPTASVVTLGTHAQINTSGRGYVMFLFGGTDCYASGANSGTDLSMGFDPGFALVKRRSSEASTFDYNLLTGSGDPSFGSGAELHSFGHDSAGVAFTEDRVVQVDGNVFEVSPVAGATSGTWVGIYVDVFMIKGATVPPANSIFLADIVADIHDRCGIDASAYDVSELTDVVAGLILAGEYTGGDAINTIRSPYFFDRYEADKKIWYPKRGAPVVGTLTIDDLVEAPDVQDRKQAIEYPKKLHLTYQHAASGYAPVKATYTRSSPDARVVGEVTTQVPVVFDEDQAAQIVHKMFKVSYAEAEGEVKLSVPESFIWSTPTDCWGLVLHGSVKRLRVESAEHADGVLSWTLKHDRQSAYTSNLTGVPIPAPTLPPSTITGSTVLAVLDISGRVDSEDDLNLLYAVTGGMDAWYGAVVQRSLDGGANYVNAATINRASIIGYLLDDVANASEDYTDNTNTVRIELYRDSQTLESYTDAQFLSEEGAFALEKPDGSFEILQYRDAFIDSTGAISLHTLHRGRLYSIPSAHTAGALFVMLDRATHVNAQSAWIGQDLTHRAVSFDQSAELAAEQTATYVGRSQIEWPIASLVLTRDGSNNITATWAPRHRFGTEDAPIASINFQGYRVTLSDGVLPAATFDTTSPTFTYDASALGAPVTVTISSLNRITGPGPATSGSV